MTVVKSLLLTLGAVIAALLVWGFVEPYFVNLKEEEAIIPNLPKAWENEEIAVIGDFQIGMWLDNDSIVEQMAEKLVELNPSAVLFLGDYIYHSVDNHEKEHQRVKELIKPLTDSDIPVFAVLGNHDYDMASQTADPNEELAEKMKSALQEVGITVLNNESAALTHTDNGVEVGNALSESLYIVGLGAEWPELADSSAAFAGVPDSAARLVMMHNPETFGTLPAKSAPVSVAGHTHGGQMRIPGTPGWSYTALINDKEDDYMYGWIDDYGATGNHLYINPGVGFSILPLRINCPPEITLFKLRSNIGR
ncbi:metallophosphoesterase [Planococcus sp. CP5-4]|uniref:metallophosphoesterase n=1 Tax=unclassified Planococcus (in: firmicutes) TaxID=2662419 RepID=UPI001C212844|nr:MULTISPECIES: metallophosphoesterase [unclassified Planococcus (in: firmicutes)]MBU9673357.1 metallophosphoesterase [Planococcus sp. CP5-4_YE]MBV0908130.1 metallophosphoesterase [Planococcus sp. CP5-4_UN]MBW6062191.1 metallophosphoesterase [Planococcus sp. CP5-4]